VQTQEEVYASIFLNLIPELNPAAFEALVSSFGTAAQAVRAGPAEWNLIEPSQVAAIQTKWEQVQRQAAHDFERVEKEKIRVYLLHANPYPALLRTIACPAPILFVKGGDIAIETAAVALVGSRRCTYYGEKMAKKISQELAEAGVTTISGLARGVDSHVHASTLAANGRTWAVIGSGLSHIYPSENIPLA